MDGIDIAQVPASVQKLPSKKIKAKLNLDLKNLNKFVEKVQLTNQSSDHQEQSHRISNTTNLDIGQPKTTKTV